MKYLTLTEEPHSLPLLTCCDSDYMELHSNYLTSGVPFNGKAVYIKVEYGEPYSADIILAEPGMIPIISSKLANAIKEAGIHYGELVPVIDDYYKDYYVLNPTLIDLIDEKNSLDFFLLKEHKVYINPRLHKYSGPEGIFRIKGISAFPYITDSVIQIIKQFDHSGIAFSE